MLPSNTAVKWLVHAAQSGTSDASSSSSDEDFWPTVPLPFEDNNHLSSDVSSVKSDPSSFPQHPAVVFPQPLLPAQPAAVIHAPQPAESIPTTPRDLVAYIVRCALKSYVEAGRSPEILMETFLTSGIPVQLVQKLTESVKHNLPSDLHHVLHVFVTWGIPSSVVAKSLNVDALPSRKAPQHKKHHDTRRKKKNVKTIRIPTVYPKHEKQRDVVEPSPAPVIPQRVPAFRSTSTESTVLVTAAVRDYSVSRIGRRLDGLPGHMSVVSPVIKATVVVSPKKTGVVVCHANATARLGGFQSDIEQWCSTLLKWVFHRIQLGITNSFTLGIALQTELSCSTVRGKRFSADLVLFHSDLLWGRVQDFGPLTSLPADMHHLLAQWSRIAVIQTRKLNNAYRDYIVSRYIMQDPEAAEFVKEIRAGCPITVPILAQVNSLSRRGFTVQWPSHFTLTKVFHSILPICLGIYPSHTEVEYDVSEHSPERYRLRCDPNHGFIVIR